MLEKNKEIKNDEVLKDKELNIDELEDVTGGSLSDVYYTPTVDISDDTRNKI